MSYELFNELVPVPMSSKLCFTWLWNFRLFRVEKRICLKIHKIEMVHKYAKTSF